MESVILLPVIVLLSLTTLPHTFIFEVKDMSVCYQYVQKLDKNNSPIASGHAVDMMHAIFSLF